MLVALAVRGSNVLHLHRGLTLARLRARLELDICGILAAL